MAGDVSRANGRLGGRPRGPGARVLARRRGQSRALKAAEITAERTMLEIGRVAFANRAAMWRDGALLPLAAWPPDALALLEGFEVLVKNAAAGDGHTDLVHKVHLAKKLGALEILAKHFRLIDEHVEVSGNMALIALLDAGRARNAAAKLERTPQALAAGPLGAEGGAAGRVGASGELLGHPDQEKAVHKRST